MRTQSLIQELHPINPLHISDQTNYYITYKYTSFDWPRCLSTRVHKTTYHMGCWFFPFNISC